MKPRKEFKFNGRAEQYDTEWEGRLSEKFYGLLEENVKAAEGLRVLDVGCGTGTILKRLSERYGISGAGVDVEEKMLAQARHKCPGMDIRCCSCDRTPFADASFDVVVACMAYHHFPDKKGFAKEAARLLKPGGMLYIADPKFPALLRKWMNALLRAFGVVGEFFSGNEIVADLSAFGFEKVDIQSDAYAQLVILTRK